MAECTASSRDIKRDLYWDLYWDLLQTSFEGRLSSFVDALRGQTLLQQRLGRTAIIEFQESGKPNVRSCNSQEELQSSLEESLDRKDGSVRRELYIVEDLRRSNIEIFGSQLGIPPSFFASFWAQPSRRLVGTDISTLSQNRHQTLKLLYVTLHQLTRTDQEEFWPGLYVDSKNNLPRSLQVLDKQKKFEVSSHQISFWSKMLDSESWIGTG